MKKTLKIVAILSVAIAMIMLSGMTVYAASATPNVTYLISADELAPGDTFTVTIGTNEMTVASFVCGVRFDTNVLEVTKRSTSNLEYYDAEEGEDLSKQYTARGSVANANANGSLGVTFAGTGDVTYYANDAVLSVTFKVKDGASGSTVLTFYEKSDGTDGYNANAATATLTIKASAPACDHSTTKAVPNGDGATHKLVCANEACNGHVVTASVECSGGTATCTEKAVCSACGAAYGTVKSHGHTLGFRYDNNDNGTHNQYCLDCQTTVNENITCTFDANTHACVVCNAVETFTVTYVYNGGNWGGNTENNVRSIPYGFELVPIDGSGSVGLSQTTWLTGVLKNGYTFVGWKADTDGQVYDPTTDIYTVTGNVTFTAQWELIHVCALTHVPAVEADCQNTGNIEYWYCSDSACGKYYSDEQGTTEIVDKTSVATPVNPDNHVALDYDYVLIDTHDVVCACGYNARVPHVYDPETNACVCGEPNAPEVYWIKAHAASGEAISRNVAVGTSLSQKADNVDSETPAGKTFKGWKFYTAYDEVNKVFSGEYTGDTMPAYDLYAQPIFEDAHVCGNLTAHEAAAATCNTAGHEAYWSCSCGKFYSDETAATEIADIDAWLAEDGDGYIAPDSTNHASDKVNYTNNDKNHSATYDCCGAAYVTNEAHTYTNHVCVCGYVERFVITMDANGGKFINGAPVYPVQSSYGTPFYAVPADPTKEGYKFVGWNTKADGTGDDIDLTPGTYTFTADLTVYAQWDVVIHSGWNEIEGEWYYYLDEQTKATGLTRVPYPTVAIDNVTYAPNAEDLAYYNSHKDTSKYSDATTAVFYFDENGVFQNDYTGPVANGSSYAVNGMAPWHVGMVKIGADYYYYSGDKTVGGNVLATGKVYATRDCGTGLRVGSGVIYIFDGEGKLEKNQGIVDGYYYNEDYTLAIGAGLIKVDTDYYYVRSNGVVVANREYWVAKTNDLEVVAGLYTFGADGKMVDPIDYSGYEDGIAEVNGALYYIKDGKCVVGAGVVELTDEEGATFYIYVKSNGQLATGKYWPTNLGGKLAPGMYDWGTDGKYYPTAN